MLHLELDDEEANFLDHMLEDAADELHGQDTGHKAAQPPGPGAGYAPSSLSLMQRLSIRPPLHRHAAPVQYLPAHPEHATAPSPPPEPPTTSSAPPQPPPEQLCRDYNDAAMHSLHAGQLPQAFEVLQLALDLCRSTTTASTTDKPETGAPTPAWSQPKWLAITYNNLACYYKRQDKPEAALHYLQLAASLESCGTDSTAAVAGGSEPLGPEDAACSRGVGEGTGPAGEDARASTLLNLCTVLCSLGRHEAALGQVQQALELLSRALGGGEASLDPRALEAAATRPLARPSASSSRPAAAAAGPSNAAPLPEAQVWALLLSAPTSRVSLLAMALYNRGVVLEHLGRLGPAGRAYQAASNLAARVMGQGSGLAKTFGKSLQMFKMKVQAERRSAVKSKAGAAGSRATGAAHQPPAADRGISGRAAGASPPLRSVSARGASSSCSLASASSSRLFPSPSCPGSVSSAPSCSGSSAARSTRLGRVQLLEGRDRAGRRLGPGRAGSALSSALSAGAAARTSPYLSSPPPPPPRAPGKGSGVSESISGPSPPYVPPAASAGKQEGTGTMPPAPSEPSDPAAQLLSSIPDLTPSPGAQLVEKWLQRHSALEQ